MPATHVPVDPSLSVNEILRRYPAAISALNAHGIDSCCGGATSLRAAALEARADLKALTREIGSLVATAQAAR
jgi:iron-sulfur cluster repair protein YtfE (RIC family)